MSLPITQDDIAALSIDQRIELVQVIWDSLTEAAEPFELTDELKHELNRRSAAHDASPGDAIPWQIVKARALARVQK